MNSDRIDESVRLLRSQFVSFTEADPDASNVREAVELILEEAVVRTTARMLNALKQSRRL